MRKIIQIATTSQAAAIGKTLISSTTMKVAPHLFALCDDGSLWAGGINLSATNKEPPFAGWERIQDVPQD